MPQAIQQHDVPAVIRSVAGMERPDYVDLFTATTDRAAPASPEQWARTALDRVAGSGGQFIWRRVLGLRLASSPQRVAGWTIADRGGDWVRLEAPPRVPSAQRAVRL